MKTIILFALLMVADASLSFGNEPLTVAELARHLGVSFWVTKVDLKGRKFEAAVAHVVNGKVQKTVLTNDLHPTDREFERLVVLIDRTPNGTKISIQPGASGAISMGRTEPSETFPIQMVSGSGVPETATEGDYFLAGDDESFTKVNPPTHGSVNPAVPGPIRIQDIKEGLVLRLHPKN